MQIFLTAITTWAYVDIIHHNLNLVVKRSCVWYISRVNNTERKIYDGKRIPLYSPDELKLASKHRKKRRLSKNSEQAQVSQPMLWQENITVFEREVDPEKNIMTFGASLESRFPRTHENAITREIAHKKLELRNRIGLPIARGKDANVGNPFYQYLVNRVYQADLFHIFLEYDRVLCDIPDDLDTKINQVTALIDELLNKTPNRQQKYRKFYAFSCEYNEQWNYPI